jgi:hypothetical protein
MKIGEIIPPERPQGIFHRVDKLSRHYGHHLLLRLARQQGGAPHIDVRNPHAQGLPPFAHITCDQQHLFVFSETTVLTGFGAGPYVKLDPLILELDRTILTSTGTPATLSLGDSVSHPGRHILINGVSIDEISNASASEVRYAIFKDLALWRSSLSRWHDQNPHQTPPALLMPDPDCRALRSEGKLHIALQEAADVAGVLATQVAQICSICLGVSSPAPRQNGTDPGTGLALIIEMSDLRLAPAQILDRDRRKRVAEYILKQMAGHEMGRLRQLKPAWVSTCPIPNPGHAWPGLHVYGQKNIGGHRRLYLETRWRNLLQREGLLEPS